MRTTFLGQAPASELVLLLLGLLRGCAADSAEEAALYNQVVGSWYSKSTPPRAPGTNATEVYLQLEVTFIGDLRDRTLQFELQTWVSLCWQDSRLNLDALNALRVQILPEFVSDGIWQPSVSFDSAGEARAMDPREVYVWTDGYLISRQRIVFKVHCVQDGPGPATAGQVCDFIVRLFYDADYVTRLVWIGNQSSPFYGLQSSIIVRPDVRTVTYDLFDVEPSPLKRETGLGAEHSAVARFRFARRPWSTLASTFVPSAIVVFVSWTSFWVDVGAAAARTTIGIVCVLVLAIQAGHSRLTNPFGTHVRTGDVWIFVCTVMVFLTLVEFAVAHSVYREQADAQNDSDGEMVSRPAYRLYHRTPYSQASVLCDVGSQTDVSSRAFLTNDLDELSKLMFPIVFILFCCFYYLWFGTAQE